MKTFPRCLAALAFLASAHACAFELDAYGRPVPDGYGQPDYSQPQYGQQQGQPQYGTPIINSADDCIGPVVAGVCHGAVAPSAQAVNPQRCYGQMLNGQCTGPQF